MHKQVKSGADPLGCQRASAPSRSVCPAGRRRLILAACRGNVACGERHLQIPQCVCRWPEARQDLRRRRSCRWRRRSRRAGTMPTRRCSMCAGSAALLPPPLALAAMLAAPTRSRCASYLQCGQRNCRVPGLGTRRRQTTHVDEVPRSSTSCTWMPATSALSRRACIRWVRRHWRSLKFCTRPTSLPVIPPEITNNEDAHPPLDSKGDHFRGRLVVRLTNPSTVPGLESSLLEPVAAPAARATLPWLGCAPAHRNLASLPVVQVQPILGADGSTRNQHRGFLGHHGIGMNDAEIHPSDSTPIQIVLPT